jgi:hypothetical protein
MWLFECNCQHLVCVLLCIITQITIHYITKDLVISSIHGIDVIYIFQHIREVIEKWYPLQDVGNAGK